MEPYEPVVMPFPHPSIPRRLGAMFPSSGLSFSNCREIDSLDKSDRIMIFNLLRVLGAVKASRNLVTRSSQVILPLFESRSQFGVENASQDIIQSLELRVSLHC
jgi:3-oxoacyl-ACP reductase-like protein